MLSHHPDHSPLSSPHCSARALSFTSFTSFASLTSSKPFRIRTSKTPHPQLLYNPHLRAPLGSAGNKELITPLESALTKNSPVSRLESALTKTWGGGGPPGRSTLQPPDVQTFKRLNVLTFFSHPLCFHTVPHSFAPTKNSTLLFSYRFTLCAQNTGGVASYRMVSISASRETWVAGKPLIENFCPPASEK